MLTWRRRTRQQKLLLYDAESQTFLQPQLASRLLEKLLAVNLDRRAAVNLPEAVELGATKYDSQNATQKT